MVLWVWKSRYGSECLGARHIYNMWDGWSHVIQRASVQVEIVFDSLAAKSVRYYLDSRKNLYMSLGSHSVLRRDMRPYLRQQIYP